MLYPRISATVSVRIIILHDDLFPECILPVMLAFRTAEPEVAALLGLPAHIKQEHGRDAFERLFHLIDVNDDKHITKAEWERAVHSKIVDLEQQQHEAEPETQGKPLSKKEKKKQRQQQAAAAAAAATTTIGRAAAAATTTGGAAAGSGGDPRYDYLLLPPRP